MLRHQLPARSPVPFGALLRAVPALGPSLARGPHPGDALTRLLCANTGAEEAVLTASGKQALALAMRAALSKQGGGLLALPAYSCYDVVTGAVAAGAPIIFYDIDPETLGPDLASLDDALAAGASVVVAAPLYGVPLDWDRVARAVRAAGALLIEDAAQAFGSTYAGLAAGRFGDYAVLSFGRGKGWTGGAGGALLARDRGAAQWLEIEAPRAGAGVVNLARAAVAWLLGRPALYGLPASIPQLGLGSTVYHEPDDACAMDHVTAAIAAGTYAAALHDVRIRRINAAGYRKALRGGTRWRQITTHPSARPSWLRYPLRVVGGNAIAGTRAWSRLGIAPGYPRPLPELPAAAERLTASRPYPGAAELVRTLVTLPTHGAVTREDRERARAALMELAPPPPAAALARNRPAAAVARGGNSGART